MVQKSKIEKSGVDKFMVEKSGLGKSRVEGWGWNFGVEVSFYLNEHNIKWFFDDELKLQMRWLEIYLEAL